MKNIALACAVAIAVSSIASTAGAMNLGSLSRQSPVAATAELAVIADPAVCHDLTCGVVGRRASDISPVLHIIFASVGGLVDKARVQFASVASTG